MPEIQQDSMTVTGALVKLKTLDKRIHRACEARFIGINIGGKSQFEIQPKENLASVKGLIERRDAIKVAIMASNASTNVIIAKEEMTVAEAIEKKSSIQYLELLRDSLQKELSAASRVVESHNAEATRRLDSLIEASMGSANDKKDDIQNLTKSFEGLNKAELDDPISIETRINELNDFIDTFQEDVDLRLSEINATTIIKIS